MSHTNGGIYREPIPPKRPASILELTQRAEIKWDSSRDFKYWLKDADSARRAGAVYDLYGDLENAFVEYARAATLILDKIPTHRDFFTHLTQEQRDTSMLKGKGVLDRMSMITSSLIDRHNAWKNGLRNNVTPPLQSHPSPYYSEVRSWDRAPACKPSVSGSQREDREPRQIWYPDTAPDKRHRENPPRQPTNFRTQQRSPEEQKEILERRRVAKAKVQQAWKAALQGPSSGFDSMLLTPLGESAPPDFMGAQTKYGASTSPKAESNELEVTKLVGKEYERAYSSGPSSRSSSRGPPPPPKTLNSVRFLGSPFDSTQSTCSQPLAHAASSSWSAKRGTTTSIRRRSDDVSYGYGGSDSESESASHSRPNSRLSSRTSLHSRNPVSLRTPDTPGISVIPAADSVNKVSSEESNDDLLHKSVVELSSAPRHPSLPALAIPFGVPAPPPITVTSAPSPDISPTSRQSNQGVQHSQISTSLQSTPAVSQSTFLFENKSLFTSLRTQQRGRADQESIPGEQQEAKADAKQAWEATLQGPSFELTTMPLAPPIALQQSTVQSSDESASDYTVYTPPLQPFESLMRRYDGDSTDVKSEGSDESIPPLLTSPEISGIPIVDSIDKLTIPICPSTNPLRDILTKLTHLDLDGQITYDSSTIKAHGGYCDVFVGEYVSSSSSMKAAVKRLRIHAQGSHDFAKQLAKEMNVWSKLVHPNILHLLGYVLEGEYPCLVSQWMENGTILHYLTTNPKSDVVQLISGIARGLEYLHELDIIHSDIKADNVLISPEGRPLICDFGISRRLSHTHTVLGGTTTGIKGSIRWMSPEILNVNDVDIIPSHTKEADVWAFGMLVYEVLTRKHPFHQFKFDAHVLFAIIRGQLPSPDHFDQLPPRLQAIWLLCCNKQTCWNKDPDQRPTMKFVLAGLERNL